MNNKSTEKYKESIKTKDFIIQKLSNPTKGEKEADGFNSAVDRRNGYAWAMAESKNYIYIGSNRNIIFSLIKSIFILGNFAETITDLIFEDDVSTETVDNSAEIFRYNKLTKKIEQVYKSELTLEGGFYESGYISAVSFKPYNEDNESIYIGAFGNNYTRILKFKENYVIDVDKPEVVFIDNTGKSSVGAMGVHEAKLYFGLMITDTDLRIMESAAPSKNTWNIVADLNDFNNIPNVDIGSGRSGGIFDLISYNGYLYAIIGSGNKPINESGFLIFKGKYIGLMAKGSNRYGWKWDMIVGPNGKYEAGMGINSYAIATPFKYKASDGKEYVYVGTFSNVIQSTQKLISFDFSYLYENFVKPTQLYRFDENDNWEMIIGTPSENEPLQIRIGNYKAGFVPDNSGINYSSNHYIWRMAEYNGKLFLGTFDSSSLYDYLIPKNIPDYIDSFEGILIILLNFLSLINVIKSEDIKTILQLFNDYEYFDDKYINNYDALSLSYTSLHFNEIKPSDYIEKVMKNIDLNYNLNILNSLNALAKKIPTSISSDNDKYLEAIYLYLSSQLGKSTIENIKNTIYKLSNNKKQLKLLLFKIKDLVTSQEFLTQLYYMKSIRKMIDTSIKGADLYVSEDGIHFKKININGFNDKYNYGLRTFVSSTDGLYIGTANPFYGGQLWKLNEI
ncbi:hypothetical protein [Paraclostridium bifermentans]|uniref:hypothetical protein n=1 Tax=Paraclostridium bifermentans TaxID=1490 RepID=UPI00189FA2EF|nr:hypothetical protein [Paraclostridium bifermentans]